MSGSLHKTASSSATTKHLPQKIRRNERERKRVHQVNLGFLRLRERVPNPSAPNKKLSKVETLREAVKYIRRLQDTLVQADSFPSPNQQPSPSCFVSSHSQPMQPSPSFSIPRYHFYNSMQVKTESPSSSSSSFYSDQSFEDPSRLSYSQ